MDLVLSDSMKFIASRSNSLEITQDNLFNFFKGNVEIQKDLMIIIVDAFMHIRKTASIV